MTTTKKASKVSKTPKYIFVVGGVMSGVGKGVTSSSIALLLQARGLN
jgi:CTP synthase